MVVVAGTARTVLLMVGRTAEPDVTTTIGELVMTGFGRILLPLDVIIFIARRDEVKWAISKGEKRQGGKWQYFHCNLEQEGTNEYTSFTFVPQVMYCHY